MPTVKLPADMVMDFPKNGPLGGHGHRQPEPSPRRNYASPSLDGKVGQLDPL